MQAELSVAQKNLDEWMLGLMDIISLHVVEKADHKSSKELLSTIQDDLAVAREGLEEQMAEGARLKDIISVNQLEKAEHENCEEHLALTQVKLAVAQENLNERTKNVEDMIGLHVVEMANHRKCRKCLASFQTKAQADLEDYKKKNNKMKPKGLVVSTKMLKKISIAIYVSIVALLLLMLKPWSRVRVQETIDIPIARAPWDHRDWPT